MSCGWIMTQGEFFKALCILVLALKKLFRPWPCPRPHCLWPCPVRGFMPSWFCYQHCNMMAPVMVLSWKGLEFTQLSDNKHNYLEQSTGLTYFTELLTLDHTEVLHSEWLTWRWPVGHTISGGVRKCPNWLNCDSGFIHLSCITDPVEY